MIHFYQQADDRRRKYIRAGIVAITVALFSFTAYQFGNGLKKTQFWVLHTLTVQEQLQRVLTDMINMETASRGFIIAGDKDYLAPYVSSSATIDARLIELKQLVSDNSPQARALSGLERSIAQKRAELENLISLRKSAQPERAAAQIKTNTGRQLMDQIRQQIAVMQQAEQTLLEIRLSALKRYYIYFGMVMIVVLAIALMLLSQLFALLDSLETKESELKKMNEQLDVRVKHRTEQLSRSNEELERFAYVSSHDLQEPLRKIAMFAQLLQSKYGMKMDPEATGYLTVITDGVSRMQNLIRDLLDYSRLSTAPATFEDVDLGKVVANVLNDLEVAIKEKNAAVQYDNLPVVRGNATHLHQLFLNLVGNAIKFQEPGAAPQVRITAKFADDHWALCVQDNGIGLEPEYAEKIFKAFQRLHRKEKYPGTGIGLAICKKIVEEHGGRIWVVSTPKKGSAFHFTFYSMKPAVDVAAVNGRD